MDLIEWITTTDKELFSFIHSDASIPLLDPVMMLLRSAGTWIPLYAFVLYWVLKYARKFAWQFVLFTLLVFAFTDYGSASILKPLFGRLRPCYETDLQPVMRNLIGCGGQNSFPSSHASNHFGLASFWYLVIYKIAGKRWTWLWIWAVLIGYAQIYVGKHYPLDILGGALYGLIIGLIFALAFIKIFAQSKRSSDSRLQYT